jgi:hypothetical protein
LRFIGVRQLASPTIVIAVNKTPIRFRLVFTTFVVNGLAMSSRAGGAIRQTEGLKYLKHENSGNRQSQM